MNNIDLEKIKNQLEAEKTEIEKKVKELKETHPDFGDESNPLEVESDETEEYENQLAQMQGLKERIEDIEVALRKINRGTYAICENCGKQISADVLEIDPESRLCKDCKIALR